jgi:hypothetical protein
MRAFLLSSFCLLSAGTGYVLGETHPISTFGLFVDLRSWNVLHRNLMNRQFDKDPEDKTMRRRLYFRHNASVLTHYTLKMCKGDPEVLPLLKNLRAQIKSQVNQSDWKKLP